MKTPAVQVWDHLLAQEMEQLCLDYQTVEVLVNDLCERRKMSIMQGTAALDAFKAVLFDQVELLDEKDLDPAFPDILYKPTREACDSVAEALKELFSELGMSPQGRQLVQQIAWHPTVSPRGQMLAMRCLVPDPSKQTIEKSSI